MSKINKGMFTSNKDDWETPKELFDALDKLFNFTLDPCASDDNHKTDEYFTKEDDGLKLSWSGTVFMNPPYSRGTLKKWIAKAYDEAHRPSVDAVVCLIPSRTDTIYWHDYVMRAELIWLVKGRIHFSGANSAPFPSAIIVFWGKHEEGDLPVVGAFDLKTMEPV